MGLRIADLHDRSDRSDRSDRTDRTDLRGWQSRIVGVRRRGDFGRAVSRILSAPQNGGENHLSQQPIPETCPAEAERGAGRSKVSYLALHPMGFSVPCRLPGRR